MPNNQVEIPTPFQVFNMEDDRGNLTVLEFSNLRIKPKRLFWVKNLPEGVMRGNHFHKVCNQVLICIEGKISVKLTLPDGTQTSYLLEKNIGIDLPTNHLVQYEFKSPDSSLLVIADQPYDPSDVFTKDDWN